MKPFRRQLHGNLPSSYNNEKRKNPLEHNSVNGRDQLYSAFEQVYSKRFNFMQGAEFSGVTVMELKTNLRMNLQNRKDKTERHDH